MFFKKYSSLLLGTLLISSAIQHPIQANDNSAVHLGVGIPMTVLGVGFTALALLCAKWFHNAQKENIECVSPFFCCGTLISTTAAAGLLTGGIYLIASANQ